MTNSNRQQNQKTRSANRRRQWNHCNSRFQTSQIGDTKIWKPFFFFQTPEVQAYAFNSYIMRKKFNMGTRGFSLPNGVDIMSYWKTTLCLKGTQNEAARREKLLRKVSTRMTP